MKIGYETQTSEVVPDQYSAIFEEWFFFKDAQGDDLNVQAWDQDGFLDSDDLMGTCVIKLIKAVGKENCTFPEGYVSLTYTCI